MHRLILLLCVLVLSGCGSREPLVSTDRMTVVEAADGLPIPNRDDLVAPDRPALIGPLDTIRIEVFNYPEFTRDVHEVVTRSGVREGLCTIFIRHTSASLTIQENADPSAKRDLEAWLNRLVKENDPLYTHTAEGPDDMPAHIKAALTQVSIGIPVANGRALLGTWQGIYIFEHRDGPHRREVVLHLSS